MHSPIQKKNINFLSQAVVATFIVSLSVSSLYPVPAKAVTVSTEITETTALSKFDAVATNLTITKSHPFIGDSREVSVKAQKKTGSSFPTINELNYYYAHLYNVDTGEYIASEEIFPGTIINLNLLKFADEGVHNYQVFLTEEEHHYQAPPAHLHDLENSIGKSNVLQWERKPLTLTLQTDDPNFNLLGSNVTYRLNQEINGDDYGVHLFNQTTGEIVNEVAVMTSIEETTSRVLFPYGDPNQFVAVLAKQGMDEFGNLQPVQKYMDLTNVAIRSNALTLKRMPWSVKMYESIHIDTDEPAIGLEITEGGGEYATYLVDRSTGDIVWASEDLDKDWEGWIDNGGKGGLSWAKAYIAESYIYAGLPRPQKLSDLNRIIADSDGMPDEAASSGTTDPKQIAGGTNPSEECTTGCHGDPINTATGEFFDTKTDIATVGTGLLPTVERSFSTTKKDSLNLLGYGWRTNYEMKIFSDETKENYNPDILTSRFLIIENENGSQTSFYRMDDGSFRSKATTLAALTYDASTQRFEYERKTDEIFVFDSLGKLIEIRNNTNQVVELDYDSAKKLISVSDNIGNELVFAYNAANRVTSITAQNGKKATYTYNTKNQLTNVVDDKEISFSYTYDSLRRVKTLTNELGGIFTNTYNTDNKVIRQVDPLGRILTFTYSGDLELGTTRIKYPNTKLIDETYINGQLVMEVENAGKANALTTWYSYDATGHLTSTVNPDSTTASSFYDERGNQTSYIDGNGNTTHFTYDEEDNLTKVKDAEGNETVNVYDDKDNLISTTTPLGETTTFSYTAENLVSTVTDPRGNAINANPTDYTSSFSYFPNRLLSSSQDSLDGITEIDYNSFGQLTNTTNPLNHASAITYNALGLPTKVTDPLQNETDMTYDQMGNVLTSKNAHGAVTTYTYDVLGNMLTMTNALNETTTYTYDSMNQPLTVTAPDGTIQSISYDIFSRPTQATNPLLQVIKQEWDKNGNRVATVDADGGRTEYIYDKNRNVITSISPTGAITKYGYDTNNNLVKLTDAEGRTYETVFDANGRSIEEKAPNGTTVKNIYDAVGNVTKTVDEKGKEKSYTYDALNRKTSYTNEIGQTVTYDYDAASNLISQTRADSTIVGYSYDARNLLTNINYAGTDEDIAYSYDSLGRKISEIKGNASPVEYKYDVLNRIISKGEIGKLVEYDYDEIGNLTSLTYPSGRVIDYGFNDAQQLTSSNTNGVNEVTLSYNNRGLNTLSTLPNGITENKSYDEDGRLLDTELLNSAANSLYKKTQKYNSAGEVTQKSISENGTQTTLENFSYDTVAQLISQTTDSNNDMVNSYNYNSVGNLNTINDKTLSYDDAGRLMSSGSSSLTYDSRNNRTAVIDSIGEENNVEYSWSVNNLLTEVTSNKENGTETTAYEYGADSLISSRTSNGSTDEFIWDTNREIPALLNDGKFEYLYKGRANRVPFAQIELSNGKITYLHSDVTGSIVATTNNNGELIGAIDYSPYGKATGSPLSRFSYAGEWVDDTTGYSYLRARWLDTDTGSFLSEDPLVQMTNNAFGYVEGNPITQIDPLGLMANPLIVLELYYTDWSEVRNDFAEFGLGVLRNSGMISTGFSVATLFAAASVGGAGAAPVLAAVSILFSAGALIYDGGVCIGLIDDNGAECNLTWVALDILGITTAGMSRVIGKTATLSSGAMTGQDALDMTSFFSGFTTTAWGIGDIAKNAQNKERAKVNQCEPPKEGILL